MTAFLAGGCSQEAKKGQEEYSVYYIDNTETRLVKEMFSIDENDSAETVIIKLLDKLAGVPNSLTCKRVLPENLNVRKEDITLEHNGRLTIRFPELYYQTTGIKEILCRSAIVKTICQVNEVKDIQFFVKGQPLKGSDDKEVGFMSDSDFLYNIEMVQLN